MAWLYATYDVICCMSEGFFMRLICQQQQQQQQRQQQVDNEMVFETQNLHYPALCQLDTV